MLHPPLDAGESGGEVAGSTSERPRANWTLAQHEPAKRRRSHHLRFSGQALRQRAFRRCQPVGRHSIRPARERWGLVTRTTHGHHRGACWPSLLPSLNRASLAGIGCGSRRRACVLGLSQFSHPQFATEMYSGQNDPSARHSDAATQIAATRGGRLVQARSGPR